MTSKGTNLSYSHAVTAVSSCHKYQLTVVTLCRYLCLRSSSKQQDSIMVNLTRKMRTPKKCAGLLPYKFKNGAITCHHTPIKTLMTGGIFNDFSPSIDNQHCVPMFVQVGAEPWALEQATKLLETVPCQMGPGDVLMLHSNTLHKSNANLSDRWRRVLITAFSTKDNQPRPKTVSPLYSPMLCVDDSAILVRLGHLKQKHRYPIHISHVDVCILKRIVSACQQDNNYGLDCIAQVAVTHVESSENGGYP